MAFNFFHDVHQVTINSKLHCYGTFSGDRGTQLSVNGFPGRLDGNKSRRYRVEIWLSMLYAYGGSFDEDDAIFVDIFYIDGARPKTLTGQPVTINGPFGPVGDWNNQGVSSFIGAINDYIIFRIEQVGDNTIGAAFSITEL